ncbi:hypothetical protein A2U01_0089363, partial [Trifolium medium]|nr:hypothetical protein [Trifolium medium]
EESRRQHTTLDYDVHTTVCSAGRPARTARTART